MSDSESEFVVKDEVDDMDEMSDDEDGAGSSKEPANVGHYTQEEKIVSAVWVHERVRNNQTWANIMRNFRARFKTSPPSKQTLLCWEKKLFSTGHAHDKERSGRPLARLMHVPYVKQSLEENPNMSIRERAKELGLSYATLKRILKNDLKISSVSDDPQNRNKKMSAADNSKWKLGDNSKKIKGENGEHARNETDHDQETNETHRSENYNIPSNSLPPANPYIHPGINPNQMQASIAAMAALYQNYSNGNASQMY